MNTEVTEKIPVTEGTLIINHHYMALQTPDGVLHPADMDYYEPYLPIWHLIRLLSCNADMSGEITERTKDVLRQTFLGEHEQLSHILYCKKEYAQRNDAFLRCVDPKTEEDYVRVLNLSFGGFAPEDADCPFVCREALEEYLRQYMEADAAFRLREAVRKGRFYGEHPLNIRQHHIYKELLALLPEETVRTFSRIKYLPGRDVTQRIMHYAILAANSLIKNNNAVIIQLRGGK